MSRSVEQWWRSRRAVPKTVFVLGAGASYDAQAPLQSELLPAITSADADSPLRVIEAATARNRKFIDFVKTAFNHPTDVSAHESGKTLEDVLTVLDRAILDDGPLKGIPREERLARDEEKASATISRMSLSITRRAPRTARPERAPRTKRFRGGFHSTSNVS